MCDLCLVCIFISLHGVIWAVLLKYPTAYRPMVFLPQIVKMTTSIVITQYITTMEKIGAGTSTLSSSVTQRKQTRVTSTWHFVKTWPHTPFAFHLCTKMKYTAIWRKLKLISWTVQWTVIRCRCNYSTVCFLPCHVCKCWSFKTALFTSPSWNQKPPEMNCSDT